MPVLHSFRRLALAAFVAALALPVFASSAPAAITLPERLGAVGDSLTAGFGAGGAAADSLRYSFSTGGDLRAERLGYSHLTRLQSMSSSIFGVNVAKSGAKLASLVEPTTDSGGNPIPSDNQVVLLPNDVDYVTVTVGSSDVCQGASPTGTGSFKRNAAELLSQLRSRLGRANVLILAMPNWHGIWNEFKGNANVSARWAASGVCTRLFGAGATNASRDEVDNFTRAYNEILANACSVANTNRFRCTFAFRVFTMNWKEADLSTWDGFHPSAKGQAKMSRAAWSSSPFRLRAFGVHFNREPVFNRAKKQLRLNFETAPHARVAIRVTDRKGHLLGKSSAQASDNGTVVKKLRARGYRGQSTIVIHLKLRINDEKMNVKRKLRL
jgi:lysophospholipase L1-like esterase